MSDDTPLYVRNDLALQAGIERLRDDFEKRVASLERQASKDTVEISGLKRMVLMELARRGSGPTGGQTSGDQH